MLDVTTWDVLFYVQGKYLYLPKYCCWGVEMVKDRKTMCEIAHYVIFLMWMAKSTPIWLLSLPIFDVCYVDNL
jgi:hypothetical protein